MPTAAAIAAFSPRRHQYTSTLTTTMLRQTAAATLPPRQRCTTGVSIPSRGRCVETTMPDANAQRQRPRRRQRLRGSGAMGGGARWTAAAITMDGGGAIAMDGGDVIGKQRKKYMSKI